MVASVQNQLRTQGQAATPIKGAAANLLSLLAKGSPSDFGADFGAKFVADFSQLIKPSESRTTAATPSQSPREPRQAEARGSESALSDGLQEGQVSQKLRNLNDQLQKQTDRLKQQDEINQEAKDSRDLKNQIARDQSNDRADATQASHDSAANSDGSPLDGLTVEQQEQLVERLTVLMAKILAGQSEGKGFQPTQLRQPMATRIRLAN